MNETRSEHPSMRDDRCVDRLTEVLAEADLTGLHPGQPGWAHRDEYRPEAESLANIWHQRGTIEVADLCAVWSHWFDDDLSGYPPDELDAVVADLRSRAAAP